MSKLTKDLTEKWPNLTLVKPLIRELVHEIYRKLHEFHEITGLGDNNGVKTGNFRFEPVISHYANIRRVFPFELSSWRFKRQLSLGSLQWEILTVETWIFSDFWKSDNDRLFSKIHHFELSKMTVFDIFFLNYKWNRK